MVTLESNRAQSPTSTPFERQAQAFQPSAEGTAKQPQAEQRAPICLRDPLRFLSLVVAGATIGSMWGLSASVLAVLGLSGAAPMYTLPAAGIVVGLAFLTLGAIGTSWARMFRFAEHATSRDRIVFFSGVASVLIAGLAAVVLSILDFMLLGDVRVVAIAVILLGLGLLWHSGVMRRVSHFTCDVTYDGAEWARPAARSPSTRCLWRQCEISS